MRYTITSPVGEANSLAFVNIEKGDAWNGFTMSVKPFIVEVAYGRETITQRYNALSIVTPYEYKIRIKRIKHDAYHWFADNPVQASRWYAKQRAKFGLGCAAVNVDSRRRVITIYVSNNATVEKYS